jgi:putative PIN family toxin of toxin-antitoxin system
MKIVFDTNVIVSALLIKSSNSRFAYEKVISRGKILASLPTLEELIEVLCRKKFSKYISLSDRNIFISEFSLLAEIIKVNQKLNVCRDPKDNKFLELAISGNADCVVTKDEDLLVLDPFRKISILSPDVFLKRY